MGLAVGFSDLLVWETILVVSLDDWIISNMTSGKGVLDGFDIGVSEVKTIIESLNLILTKEIRFC